MTEHAAPYLHVVRSTPTDAPADLPTRADGAEEVETDGIPVATLVATAARSAPPYVDSELASESADAPASDADVAAASGPAASGPAASAPLAQAVMYATMSWLALCVERVAVAVDIQPVAERMYEVSAHFDEEHSEGIILRVRLDVEPGLVVRTTVEPLRP